MTENQQATYNIVIRFPLAMKAKLHKRSQREGSINALVVKLVAEGLDTPPSKRKYERKGQKP